LFSIKFEEEPKVIVELLRLGTNLPIWEEFYPYILYDLNHFSSKSMILVQNGNVDGQVLLYSEDNSTLYFGFFGIRGDKTNMIAFLIDKIKEYAKNKGYNTIRGPINIPTIIFGWGFEEGGSKNDIFIQKPTNHPKYIKIFLEKGFYVKNKELSLEGNLNEKLVKMLELFEFKDYQIYHPNEWEELYNMKFELLALSAKNLSSSSQMTPGMEHLFLNYINFVRQYGSLYMFGLLKHIPSNELVGCSIGLPNPFHKNKNGNIDSFVVYLLILDKAHRGIGLGNYLALYTLNKARENGITFSSSSVEDNNEVVISLGAKLGHKPTRIHTILEYRIVNE